MSEGKDRTDFELAALALGTLFEGAVQAAARERFGIEVEVGPYPFTKRRLVMTRADGKNFTRHQRAFLDGYIAGFGEAMRMVGRMERGDEQLTQRSRE